MDLKRGTIALMGSGELTATMVEVHKDLLAGVAGSPKAVFLDTPAGFQLNVDQISRRAVEYFRAHIQQPMSIASYKSGEITTAYEAEQAFQILRKANFFLIGPGSPTYTVRQLRHIPITEILIRRIEEGGCLVAASAAALTVGRFTLPVYEIYKVGEELHWVEGLNILGHFGLNLVVIPHWNNAEGGTHDTRFCYMGEPRFLKLKSLLPEDVSIFGLDEHTACIIDLEKEEAVVRGIGCVTLCRQDHEMVFQKGDRFTLDLLRGREIDGEWKTNEQKLMNSTSGSDTREKPFWERVHSAEKAFYAGLEKCEPKESSNALLELDRIIWEAQEDFENAEFISQARDILRELIVSLGIKLEVSSGETSTLTPLVEELLALRQKFRDNNQWEGADAVRECLQRSHILIEDTEEGPRWRKM